MDGSQLYYLVVFGAAVLAWLSQIIYRRTQRKTFIGVLLLVLSYFLLLFLLGTRVCGVGVDDKTYSNIFTKTTELGVGTVFTSTMIEPGYLLLNRLVGLFTSDYQIMIFIVSALSLVFVYATLLRELKVLNLFMAVLLFGMIIYPYYFGIIRLSLAVSITFFATRYLIGGNRAKYNLMIMLAASIHYSALIMLIMNLIVKKPLDRKTLKSFYAKLLIIIPAVLIAVSALIVPSIGGRYSQYTLNSTLSLSILDFDKIPIVLLGLFFLRMTEKRVKNYPLYLFMYSLSIIITFCSAFVSFGRAEWYFNIYACLVIPSILSTLWNNEKERVLSMILVPVFVIYGIIYSAHLMDKDAHILDIEHYNSVLFEEA